MSGGRALAIPLLIVASLGLVLGFVVTRQLAPQGAADAPRVSVIEMASTPAPDPTEEPTPDPETEEESDDAGDEPSTGSSGRSRTGNRQGGSGNCPAGCTCESRPPAGVMIVCRGS